MSSEFSKKQETTTYLECFELGIVSENKCFDTGIILDDKSDAESYLSEHQERSVLSAKQSFPVKNCSSNIGKTTTSITIKMMKIPTVFKKYSNARNVIRVLI